MTGPLAIQLPEELLDEIARRAAARVASSSAEKSEPWIDADEAARHLGCKRQRIYDLTYRKDETQLPHRKEGGRLLTKRSWLDRYVEQGGRW